MTATTTPSPAEAVEELAGRLFTEGVSAFHLNTVYLGVKLGLFRELATGGAQTAEKLAAATGLDPWYVREWLQAEATAGLVHADHENLQQASFTLAPGVHETLVDETNPGYLGGLPLALGAVGGILPALLDAFHTGRGVPYTAYGPDAVEAQAAMNRPAFTHDLVGEWLPQIPDVHARLSDAARPARVADVGCGLGWAAIRLSTAFPHIHVDGYDSDEESITQARRNASDAGVGDRVTFRVVDAANGGYGDRRYDVVFFFECVHDMAHPVQALASARESLAEGGTVIVMDERVAEKLTPGEPTEIFFATASVLWCLPQGRVEADSEAPGTVMRPATFEAIAQRAGWASVEVLPIEHPFWRFYRPLAG
jgi:SAM-dependent methyltransferase